MFSLEQLGFGGVPHKYSSSKGYEYGGGNMEIDTHLFGKEGKGEPGNVNYFSSDFGFYEDNTAEDGLLLSKYQHENERPLFSNFGVVDDLYFDAVSPPFQSCLEEITKLAGIHTEESLLVEPKKEKPCATPLTSLGILKNYGTGFKRLNGKKIEVPSSDTASTKPKLVGRKLSTAEILRLAGEKFIQFSSQRFDGLSTVTSHLDTQEVSHPYSSSFIGLSDDETKDAELIVNLLASAEKVGQQQFERARKLLIQCNELSSDVGNPVQRVVYYFSEALGEKIDRETGRITSNAVGKKQLLDLDEARISPNPAIIAFHKAVPVSQVCQFTATQIIIESVAEAKKVHLVDFEIRSGIQCTVLMQALASRSECPLKLLKITAVGTKLKSKMEETGKRLMSFAQSLNLPFVFNVVIVSEMLDLTEDLFDLVVGETVVVYASYSLRAMIPWPDRLESFMKTLGNINPCIMVLIEVEASHNSPIFVSRFFEALYFYGAFFDCLEDCMEPNDPNRKLSESMYFSSGIRNIVAAEGEERIIRHVNISVWRAFFARFGLTEVELSTSTLYQASLVVKNFACGSSCSFGMDGNCLIVGWKGTPLHSISAWKFT